MWQYRDPTGQVQGETRGPTRLVVSHILTDAGTIFVLGPFSAVQMHEWYRSNFFTDDLLVKRVDDASFEPLGVLILRLGDATKPFLLPPPPAAPPGFSIHHHQPRGGAFDHLPPSREPSDPWAVSSPSLRQPQVPSRQFTTAYDPFAPTQEQHINEPVLPAGNIAGNLHHGSLDSFGATPRSSSSIDPWLPKSSGAFDALHSTTVVGGGGPSPWSPDFGSAAAAHNHHQVFGEPQPFGRQSLGHHQHQHHHAFNLDSLPSSYPSVQQPDPFSPAVSSTPFFDSSYGGHHQQANGWPPQQQPQQQRSRPVMPTPSASLAPIGQSPWGSGGGEAARSSTFDERVPLLPRNDSSSIAGHSTVFGEQPELTQSPARPAAVAATAADTPPAPVASSPPLPMASKTEQRATPPADVADATPADRSASLDSAPESDAGEEQWHQVKPHTSTTHEQRAPAAEQVPQPTTLKQSVGSGGKVSVVSEAEFGRKRTSSPSPAATAAAPPIAAAGAASSPAPAAKPAPWVSVSEEPALASLQPSISLREIQAKEAEEARRAEAKRAAERQARAAREAAAAAAAAESQEALAPTSTWAAAPATTKGSSLEAPWAKTKPVQQVKKTLKEIQDEEARQKKAAQQAINRGYAGSAAVKPPVRCVALVPPSLSLPGYLCSLKFDS
jgi:PERQ amino acid-rich with GYF domain-containing protein